MSKNSRYVMNSIPGTLPFDSACSGSGIRILDLGLQRLLDLNKQENIHQFLIVRSNDRICDDWSVVNNTVATVILAMFGRLAFATIKPKGQIQMSDVMYNYRQGEIHSAEFSDEFNKLCIPFEDSLSEAQIDVFNAECSLVVIYAFLFGHFIII